MFIKTPENHLRQYQTGIGWVDLGATSGNLVPYGTSFPAPSENALFNKLDEGLIYQRIGSNWVSLGSNASGLPTGTSTLNFYDPNNGRQVAANLYLIITQDDNDPLLATDQGLVVKKDIAAGGFLSSNQGVLMLGNGLNSKDEDPKIILTHSNGYGTKDTLYLKQFGGSVAAHLDLGNLAATQLKVKSTNNVFAVTAGDNGLNQDTYLIPQNPSQGGLGLGTTAYPFKWVDATYVFTNNINSLSGGAITVNVSLDCSTVIHGGGSSGDAFKVGDDIYLVDVNEANTVCLQGAQTRANAKIYFGSDKDTNLYRSGPNQLKTDDSFIVGAYGSISTAGDAIFNSVTGTASGAFKVGTAGGTTYVSLTRSGSIGYLTSHYGDLRLASTGTIWFESPASPTGAGTKNMGSASAYWNEVNAKSFIDRGCPFWIEPHEAKEILKEIKPHPTLKSVNTFKDTEVPQFDYSSLPEILKPNEGDGIRAEALLYAVFHVVRDLMERVEALEMKAG